MSNQGVKERIRSLEGASPSPQSMRIWEFAAHGRCSDPQFVTIDQRSMHTTRFRPKPEHANQTVREVIAELARVFGNFKVHKDMVGYHELMLGWQLRLSVACRQCAACRHKRANEWARRAHLEIEQASRTWFVTLTFSPTVRSVLTSRARMEAAGENEDFDVLADDERFQLIVRVAGPEVTKWLKRVRKRVGGKPIRYVLVAEPHKDGMVHFHALLHEVANGSLTYRDVTEPWLSLGFVHAKLVKSDVSEDATVVSDVAWYVCKYLHKHARARVRASMRYGLGSLEALCLKVSAAHSEAERRRGRLSASEGQMTSSPGTGFDEAEPSSLAGVASELNESDKGDR